MMFSSRNYAIEQRPKVVPLYGARSKEFAVLAPPTRLVTTGPIRQSFGHRGYEPRQEYKQHDSSMMEYGILPSKHDKSKGLRHFSMKVCEKVKGKGRTTYNEVADELVSEYFEGMTDVPDQRFQTYDMKNIRRRVYDALNVLMAMNIIEKHNKEIRWNGLPTSAVQEIKILESERTKKEEKLKEKYDQCLDLMIQLASYKNLVRRNRQRELEEGRREEEMLLYLPYLIVSADPRCHVDCAISRDKSEYVFHFEKPFEMFDDVEALKRLGLADGLDSIEGIHSSSRSRTRQLLPPTLRTFVDEVIDEVEAAKAAERKPFIHAHLSHPSPQYNTLSSDQRLSAATYQAPKSMFMRTTPRVMNAPPRYGTPLLTNTPMVRTQTSMSGVNSVRQIVPSHTTHTSLYEGRPIKKEQQPMYTQVYQYTKDQDLVASEMVEMEDVEGDDFTEVIYEDVGATEEIEYE